MKTLRILISGRVQGVGFRWFLKRKAKEWEIRGYAENLPDGSVEVIAQGNDELINKFLVECRRGPLLARVDNVIFTSYKKGRVFDNFQIK